MSLLDSDVLIWALRNRPDIVEAVSRLKSKSPTCLSVISIAEIYQNVLPQELTLTEQFIYSHAVFPVYDLVAKEAGFIWQQFSKKTAKLSLADCLIAATAKLNGLVLVTMNVKHFSMKEIEVEHPLGF